MNGLANRAALAGVSVDILAAGADPDHIPALSPLAQVRAKSLGALFWRGGGHVVCVWMRAWGVGGGLSSCKCCRRGATAWSWAWRSFAASCWLACPTLYTLCHDGMWHAGRLHILVALLLQGTAGLFVQHKACDESFAANVTAGSRSWQGGSGADELRL